MNLAIAALGDPQVLLLDEPAAALDPRQRRDLWARAGRLTASGGAVLFATQTLEELDRLADRVVVLLAYPVAIAGLVGLVAGYANAKPRVALVDRDGLPRVVALGGQRFDIERTIRRVSDDVALVRLSADEAEQQLRAGKIVASVTVPSGFLTDLRGMSRSPRLELRTTAGGLSSRVTQQVQALVYSLNRQLQGAFIAANLEYVDLIQRGGTGTFLGRRFEILGLDGMKRLLEDLPPGPGSTGSARSRELPRWRSTRPTRRCRRPRTRSSSTRCGSRAGAGCSPRRCSPMRSLSRSRSSR